MRHRELREPADDARRRTAEPDPVLPRAAIVANAGNHALGRYLQRKRVPVSGGVFSDHTYQADNDVMTGQKKTGAKMRLEFEPNDDLATDRVSLVQTVKRDVKVGGARLEQGTSGMALRGDVEKEPVIDAELMGEESGAKLVPEIDVALGKFQALVGRRKLPGDLMDRLAKARATAQDGSYAVGDKAMTQRSAMRTQIQLLRKALVDGGNAPAPMLDQLDAALEGIRKVVVKSSYLSSLDPRYTEQRKTPTAPFAQRPAETNVEGHIGHTATKRDGKWQNAQLRDWPGPTADPATPVSGGMDFEVAAMTEAAAGKPAAFVGSVRWGFATSPPNIARLDPAELQLKNPGVASPEFFGAAERWNKMQVPTDAGPVAPLQLPVHQKPSSTPPTTPAPTTAKPTAKAEPPAEVATPLTARQTTARWAFLQAATPPKKAGEIGFAAKQQAWLERSGEPEMLAWSAHYLDWLNGTLLKDATALDKRWNEIVDALEDLITTPNIHATRLEAKRRHTRWLELYGAVKAGTWPTADMLFVEPVQFLDDVEAKWKGNTAARWSEPTLYWKVQKAKTRTGTYWK